MKKTLIILGIISIAAAVWAANFQAGQGAFSSILLGDNGATAPATLNRTWYDSLATATSILTSPVKISGNPALVRNNSGTSGINFPNDSSAPSSNVDAFKISASSGSNGFLYFNGTTDYLKWVNASTRFDLTHGLNIVAGSLLMGGSSLADASRNVTGAAGTFTGITDNGNTTIGASSANTVAFNSKISSSLYPSTDGVSQIGISGSTWSEIYCQTYNSSQDLILRIDENNNGTNNLLVKDGGGTTRFTFSEAGDETIGNTLHSTASTFYVGGNGDVRINPDWDANGTNKTYFVSSADASEVSIDEAGVLNLISATAEIQTNGTTRLNQTGNATFATAKVNTGATSGYVPSVIYTDVADHSNTADTTLDALGTKTIDASTLVNTGDSIIIYAAGVFASNANNKGLSLVFGSTTLVATGTITGPNGSTWEIEACVYRTGAATQRAVGRIRINPGIGSTPLQVNLYTAPTETLSGTVAITVKGSSPTTGAASDVTEKIFSLEVRPSI